MVSRRSRKAEKFQKLSEAGNTARWNRYREQLAKAGIDRDEHLAALNRERVRRFRAKQLKGKKAA